MSCSSSAASVWGTVPRQILQPLSTEIEVAVHPPRHVIDLDAPRASFGVTLRGLPFPALVRRRNSAEDNQARHFHDDIPSTIATPRPDCGDRSKKRAKCGERPSGLRFVGTSIARACTTCGAGVTRPPSRKSRHARSAASTSVGISLRWPRRPSCRRTTRARHATDTAKRAKDGPQRKRSCLRS